MIVLQKFHAVYRPLHGVDCGRKRRLRRPADLSGHSLFPVARWFVPLPPRTRRDASPPRSGGLFLHASAGSFAACPRWRGSG
jgi:hypothetical protein